MEFYNNATLEGIIDKEVTVVLVALPGMEIAESAENCLVFMRHDWPHIDFIPQLTRQCTAPLPHDALVSRNETDLTKGRHWIVVTRQSEAGRLLAELLAAKKLTG